MTKQRLISILFFLLAIHLMICVLLLFAPKALNDTSLSNLYRVHLLPGPFFGQDKVGVSYLMAMTTMKDGIRLTGSPVQKSFVGYHDWFNPTHLYRNRFERSLYQGLFLPGSPPTPCQKDQKDFAPLVQYLNSHLSIDKNDSSKVIFIRKKTSHFKITYDTLCTLDLR